MRRWIRKASARIAWCLFLASSTVRADSSACWQELVFEAGNAWAVASTTLRFSRVPATAASRALMQSRERTYLQPRGATVGLLEASLSAMKSAGEQQIWFEPSSGQVLQIRRVGHGRDSRIKLHRFMKDGIWRERRSPEKGQDGSAPETWPLRSAGMIPYPAEVGRSAVIAPLLLLQRASSLATRPTPGKLDFPVMGDTRLHRVVLESRPDSTLDADVRIERDGRVEQLSGTRTVRHVDLRPHLLGKDGEDEAFSLLELEGETSITIDIATGLPLQVTGEWLRVGSIPVTLRRARLAGHCSQ